MKAGETLRTDRRIWLTLPLIRTLPLVHTLLLSLLPFPFSSSAFPPPSIRPSTTWAKMGFARPRYAPVDVLLKAATLGGAIELAT
jgi:hypothetical protein